MNRTLRRQAARRQRQALRVETVTLHCADCDAPMCPVCGDHTTLCDSCNGFHCETCGYFLGKPAGEFLGAPRYDD
jgi:hypothetical protein